MTQLEETRSLIARHFEEIFNKGNLEFADQVYTPDAIIHDPTNPELPAGPEGIKQICRADRAGFPDIHFDIQAIIVEGDLAATRWTVQGTHKGEFMGVAPTGKFGSVSGISMSRIVNGRIAEVWLMWDVLGVLRNMGVELPLKAEALV